MKTLYKFKWDCGRGGNVEGRFIEDSAVVDKCLGKKVYFGEILGKHSEVFGVLDKEDLEIITEDQHDIEIIEKHLGKSFGRNPLNYLRDEYGDDLCPYDL